MTHAAYASCTLRIIQENNIYLSKHYMYTYRYNYVLVCIYAEITNTKELLWVWVTNTISFGQRQKLFLLASALPTCAAKIQKSASWISTVTSFTKLHWASRTGRSISWLAKEHTPCEWWWIDVKETVWTVNKSQMQNGSNWCTTEQTHTTLVQFGGGEPGLWYWIRCLQHLHWWFRDCCMSPGLWEAAEL